MFLSTVQQLKSIPILFESLPILEEVRDGSIMSVDDSWKTGKENWEGIPTHCSDKLAQKSLSKLIVVKGLYINAN